ncbi:MAG: ERF family protein [Candidatus Hydrogenedentes bacterium]|nr:ERF family protein [Candidatus Hydrogenedentota bacterium]
MATRSQEAAPEPAENAAPAQPRNLYQRMLAVMSDVGYVQRDRKAPQAIGAYSYASHDAVTARIRPALVQHGIVCISSLVRHDLEVLSGNKLFTRVSMEIVFINVDNPEDRHTVHAIGYGIDGQDKSIGKAVSYAVKIGLLKALMLETGDDPEQDSNDYAPTQGEAQRNGRGQNGNGKNKAAVEPPPPAAPPQEAPASKNEVIDSCAEAIQEAVHRMGYQVSDLSDVLRARFGVKRFRDLDQEKAVSWKREILACEKFFQSFHKHIKGGHPDLDDAQLIDSVHETLMNKASLDYDSKPLRATSEVWCKWLNEVIKDGRGQQKPQASGAASAAPNW